MTVRGRKISLRHSGSLGAYLSHYKSSGRVRIVRTVYEEFPRALRNEVHRYLKEHMLPPFMARHMTDRITQKFHALCVGTVIDDDLTMLQDVRSTYGRIWKKPSNRDRISLWARHKRTDPSRGPPRGNDEVILSTAAALAKGGGGVELLTFDHDFTLFSEDIRRDLGVDVMDAAAVGM